MSTLLYCLTGLLQYKMEVNINRTDIRSQAELQELVTKVLKYH